MTDLTIIYYTANRISEEVAWRFRRTILENAPPEAPIISVSQIPFDFGKNICVGRIGSSVMNIYRQVLEGCLIADTEYVAMCEDDCLYTKEHFVEFRPQELAYNRSRWNLVPWRVPPIFYYKDRSVFSQLIAKREVLIEAMKERLALKNPKIYYLAEPGRYDLRLGVTLRKTEAFYATKPNIVFDHVDSMQFDGNGLGKRKKIAEIRSDCIWPWGFASDVVLKYFGKEEWKKQVEYKK